MISRLYSRVVAPILPLPNGRAGQPQALVDELVERETIERAVYLQQTFDLARIGGLLANRLDLTIHGDGDDQAWREMGAAPELNLVEPV